MSRVMFSTLWRRRERPVAWRRRVKVWAKRLFHLPALLRLALRIAGLRLRGAQIGPLAFVGQVRIEGCPARLAIGEEASLGRCEIALYADVTIGRRVVVNDGAVLLTGSHSLRDPVWGLRPAPISIEDYAWIAHSALILPGVSIGRGAVVGAGAVVRKDVPAYAVAIGNPAFILPNRRLTTLEYSPARLAALFEAWLGQPLRSASTVETDVADCVDLSISGVPTKLEVG